MMCCGVRKVEPLGRALESVNGWITGLRRDQGMERSDIDIVEWDAAHDAYKINPLANWTFSQVREYIDEHSVPYNELHDRGYPSLYSLGITLLEQNWNSAFILSQNNSSANIQLTKLARKSQSLLYKKPPVAALISGNLRFNPNTCVS